MEQLVQLFHKLRVLRYAPKEDWEWDIYFEEFSDCEIDLMAKTIDFILKNYDEFPKPATIWKVYYKFFNEENKNKNKKLNIAYICDKCYWNIILTIKEEELKDKVVYCENCGEKLMPKGSIRFNT